MASMAALRQLQACDGADTQAQASVELLNQGHHQSAHQHHLLMSYHQHHNRSHHMATDITDHYHTYQQQQHHHHQQQQQQFINQFGSYTNQLEVAPSDSEANQHYGCATNQHYQQYPQITADQNQVASMSPVYQYQQQQQQQQYGQEPEHSSYNYSAFLQAHQNQQAGGAYHSHATNNQQTEPYGSLAAAAAATQLYAPSTPAELDHDVKLTDCEQPISNDVNDRTRNQTNGAKSDDNNSDIQTSPRPVKRKASKSKKNQSAKRCSLESPKSDALDTRTHLKSRQAFDLQPEESGPNAYFLHTRHQNEQSKRDALYEFAHEGYRAASLSQQELVSSELPFVDLGGQTQSGHYRHADQSGRRSIATPQPQTTNESLSTVSEPQASTSGSANNSSGEHNQLRILEMRKEKSRDAARSRRSKENHEFYELAKLLPLPAAITSQLDFLDKASIIRLTISFLKLRQFSVNGHPPWAPDFTTLGSVNPYSSQSLSNYAEHYASGGSRHSNSDVASPRTTPNDSANYLNNSNNSLTPTPSLGTFQVTHQLTGSSGERNNFSSHGPGALEEANTLMIEKSILKSGAASLFDIHQGTHILQSLDGFAFAIGRDGRFLYISETVSMYLGLSQVEMTGSSVFDYTHQQDHEELAAQLGIPYNKTHQETGACCESPPAPNSVLSQYSAASSETLIEEHLNHHHRQTVNSGSARKRPKASRAKLNSLSKKIKIEHSTEDSKTPISSALDDQTHGKARESPGIDGDPLVRQFCIRMKSTLTKRGCQHFKSSGYRVVHVVAHMRTYQSNDHGHLMDPLDESELSKIMNNQPSGKESASVASGAQVKASKRRGPKVAANNVKNLESSTTASKSSESNNNNNVEDELDVHELKSGQQKQKLLAADEKRPGRKIIGMVAVAIALPPPSINELRLDSDTFVLRLGLDLRVSHIEPKITELLNYPVEMLAGKSLYSIVHPADVRQLQSCHAELLKKGQMMSGYYRLLAQSGGYIWIQTCATLICNNNPVSLPGPSTLAASSSSTSSRGQSNSPMPMRVSSSSIGAPSGINQQAAQSYGTRLPICADVNFNSWRTNQISQPSPSSSANGAQMSTFEAEASQQVLLGEQQQEQCVIFVNYMITDVVETDSILDVCQSQDACQMVVSSTPLPHGQLLARHQASSQNSFSSPVSSCASPAAMKSLQAPYSSTGTPSNAIMNLASPQQQSVTVHHQQQRRASNGQQQTSGQPRAGKQTQRRANPSSKTSQRQHHRHQSASYSTSLNDTNGSDVNMSAYSNHSDRLLYAPNSNSFQQQQQQEQNAHQNIYVTDTTPDGVALALRQQQQQHHQQNHQDHHHQHHHATTFSHNTASSGATNSLESPGAAAALAADYAAVDRSSIYKAATFAAGLAATEAVAAAGSYGTQQAAAAGAYQQAAGYYHHAHQYYQHHHHHHTPHAALHHSHNHRSQTSSGGWQDSSAASSAAAVVAVAANTNASAAAAAAAASIPSYYNYHGYYGNRFI